MNLQILYFAQLAEAAGTDRESISGEFRDLAAVYAACQQRHHFHLQQNQLRVARNHGFASWEEAPAAGDEIAFIPPVAGG